jgi:hypothetical protein
MKLVLWEVPELELRQLFKPTIDAKTSQAAPSASQGDLLRILFPLKGLRIETEIKPRAVPQRVKPIVYQE